MVAKFSNADFSDKSMRQSSCSQNIFPCEIFNRASFTAEPDLTKEEATCFPEARFQ